ncbi:MAG: glutamine synthetase family protein [Granulosicoccus sp.]|nr:glutamine synthetase family protein [Granulosicoccus sp.]
MSSPNPAAITDWLTQHPDVTSLHAGIVDLNGTMRGKRLPVSQIRKLLGGKMRLPLSTCNVDIWGADIEGSPLVFESGDGDGQCVWTGRSELPMSWLSEPSLLIPLSMQYDDGQPFFGDPRQVLNSVKLHLDAQKLKAVVAFELEFYLTEVRDGKPVAPRSPVTGEQPNSESVYSLSDLEQFDQFLNDVYTCCSLQNIPADAALTENGAGQFEINLLHGDDPLKAADDAVFFKRLIKGIARKHGFVASFMAKPFTASSGSGMHVHFSMLDSDDNNIFDNGQEDGTAELHHAVAGVLEGLAPCTALFAPHLNSYRRLEPETHAPTQIAWGYENRTAAIRIPGGPAAARRIEHRVPGADANPYLVLAAILGSALQGLNRKQLPIEPLKGNAYTSSTAGIPSNWQDALSVFTSSPINKEIFPEPFLALFSACKQQEINTFSRHMSAFEITSYLDVV